MEASSATVTAARTCSASITATNGAAGGSAPALPAAAGRLAARRGPPARPPASGFTAAVSTLASNGFCSVPSASTRLAAASSSALGHAGGQDDPHVAMPRAHLQVLADFEAGAARHHGIGHHHVGIDVFQADQRRIGVRDGDDFVALFAQDTLADALRVRAIVHQQDAAHYGFFGSCSGCLLSGGF